MLRRAIDLSLVTYPSEPGQLQSPPAFQDEEIIGSERPRTVMQGTAKIEPYRLDKSGEVMMDITLGHSTPHTHVDVFLHHWYWFNLTEEEKSSVRSTGQVSVGQMVGEAALVDLSDFDIGQNISLSAFKERAGHVRRGDIVLVKTGHRARYEAHGGHPPGDVPLITPDIAEWVVREKQIKVYGQDVPPNGMFKRWYKVEKVFYLNGVLMIDFMVNLENLNSERFFVNTGVVMRWMGADDSPARVVAVETDGRLAEGRIVDLFAPIKGGSVAGRSIDREEPFECKSAIMKRYRVKNFQMDLSVEYGSAMNMTGFVGFKTFSNRLGTHIQVPIDGQGEWDLSSISTERLTGPATCIDLTSAGPGQNIRASDLDQYGGLVEENDIMIVRTGFTDNYYYEPDFMKYTPGFTVDAIEWICQKRVKAVITDMGWVESSPHAPASPTNRALLSEAGIPVVNCASHMWMLRKPKAYAFISPLPLAGLDTSPCRVVVVEEWE